MDTLHLDIVDFKDPDHWRFVLKSQDGAFLADHPVALDRADPHYRGFIDLPDYLKHYAADREKRDEQERKLVDGLGAWIGEKVFGPIAAKIVAHSPVVVRVAVPETAEALLTRPFELAHAHGRPLALQDVSLVYELPDAAPPPRSAPIADRLRILALFSLPPATGALNLREERQALKRLVAALTGTAGLAVELKVLQYGVTRALLGEALDDGEGWDVVHFSGHGVAGSLVLEDEAGGHDLVPATDLVQLLRLTRKRLKLVTLSACHSAAATIEQTLAWLGIDARPRRDGSTAATGTEAPPPVVARELVTALDTAVLAMRYAVEDDFVISLGLGLYEKQFAKTHDLPRAAQRALTESLQGDCGALSVATPALFGRRAAGLSLRPPVLGTTDFTVPETGLAEFPAEPPRFVGRVKAMTDASAALAPQSGKAGVLFHGMAGGGKTACAVELARHHETAGRFRAFAWFQAPEEGKDIALARRDFALALERQLPGVSFVHLVDRPEELAAWLPRFRETLKKTAALIVLDNLESLMTAEGHWRDPFWGSMLAALAGHNGFSRVVLTSRIRPAGLPDNVAVIPIHALPLDEALLLARSMPNLGALIRGTAAEMKAADGRALARRVLRIVQGHPKLIELADGRAADPAELTAQVAQAEGQWSGGALDAFFTEGESRGDAEAFLKSLEGWTDGIVATLADGPRTLFQVLCSLEEGDREGWIIEGNWADVWHRLARLDPVPALADALDALSGVGLIAVTALADDKVPRFRVALHPGVAEAGRTAAGEATQTAVDTELAAFWRTVFLQALEWEQQGKPAGPLIVRAGLAAAPYLMRLSDWATASTLLERVSFRDRSPATLGAILPLMQRIFAATADTDRGMIDRGRLASLLRKAGRIAEAEAMLRETIDSAEAAGQFRSASVSAGHLINLLRATGRAAASLPIVDRKIDLARRAGLGPWTQIADEARRMQLLAALGRNEEALAGVDDLRTRMQGLPERAEAKESVDPWNVRETVFDIGHAAALALKDWQQALELNAESLKSTVARGGSALEQARTRFNGYGPLLPLGRLDDAAALLRDCRAVFEPANAIEEMGAVLSAQADLEARAGRPAQATGFEQAALKYTYLHGAPDDAANSHFNLANYILGSHGPAADALAHRLAALLLRVLTQSGLLQSTAQALVRNLAKLGPDEAARHLPGSFDDLCTRVEQVEGVRFREMVTGLAGPDADLDAQLQEILTQAFAAARGAAPLE
ncbi:MAG: CHAT domain-containing protein [Alphaproteobacteria bacterium]|nr:CHAT domain-containing protein [Alphaproteobacteria bacterium]